jgi:hypothetical protein
MLTLDRIFDDTVARGWRPRSPAFGAELLDLEQSRVRGDCTAPLLVDGDLVFIDRTRRAQPGDFASFMLSSRGARAQNSSLPPGQSPWAPGSNWLKLLCVYHGYEFLLDRHGNSATATLMACESPDDTPVLHPVRNVARGGRLLFAPDAHSGQIGTNAATVVSETSISAHTLTDVITAILSQTVGPLPAAATVVVTMSGYITAQNTTSTLLTNSEMAYAVSTASGSLPSGHPFWDVYSVPEDTTVGANFTYEASFALAENTSTTYYFNASNVNTTDNVLTIAQLTMKCEAIMK